MNDRDINAWISESGLSGEECAMIQPNYGYYPAPEENLSTTNAVSTAALSGTNLAFNMINAIQMSRGKVGIGLPVAGMITGSGQLLLGIGMLEDKYSQNKSTTTAAMINIGIGTATLFLSTWTMISGNTVKEKKTTWNLSGFPAGGSSAGIALQVTHRF
jgi:hypothetical protein